MSEHLKTLEIRLGFVLCKRGPGGFKLLPEGERVYKAAVERSLVVTTSVPIVGAWYWQSDTQVDFRPRTYWPVGTRVSFVGQFDGVEGAPGIYGTHELTQSFEIEPAIEHSARKSDQISRLGS